MNTESLAIKRCKMTAKSDEYFNLFFKNIGNFDWHTCLLAFIGNESVITKIITINPTAQYIIFDDPFIEKILKLNGFNLTNIKFIDCEKDFASTIGNLNMKFDKIIMNPPYSKNLHLKILAKAIEKLTDDGNCVNLSPIRWLQDPYSQFKTRTDVSRFNESILNHLMSINIIDQKTANDCFSIGLYVNLGIYLSKSKANKNNNYNEYWKERFSKNELNIFEKVSNHKKHLTDVIQHGERQGIRVLIADIGGNRGMLPIYKDIAYAINGMKDGKDWTKCKNNGGYEKEEGVGIPNSIKFNTEKEAQNFYDSYKTKFARFICNYYITDQHIPIYWLPWMGDCINPRTKKKGYESDWTNEDFYKYFNITKEEQKIIEESVEKHNYR